MLVRMDINLFVVRAKVVLKALPTYLALVATIIGVLLDEIVPLLPDNIAIQVSAIAATVLAWIAAVIAAIRRLTPADPETYGLLPPPLPPISDGTG